MTEQIFQQEESTETGLRQDTDITTAIPALIDEKTVAETLVLQNTDITIVIPALNEERIIARVIGDLHRHGYHDILVVDGQSEDGTARIAKENGARILVQGRRGKGDALRQAVDHLLFASACSEIIVMMDADGSMNIEDIPRLVKALESGADLVKASRFLPGGHSEDMTWFRNFGNRLLLFLVNALWSFRYTDLCYGFAAFKKSAIEALFPLLKSINFEIETEIFVRAKRIGLTVTEVPSLEFRRAYGVSNLRALRDGLSILGIILGEFKEDRLARK